MILLYFQDNWEDDDDDKKKEENQKKQQIIQSKKPKTRLEEKIEEKEVIYKTSYTLINLNTFN